MPRCRSLHLSGSRGPSTHRGTVDGPSQTGGNEAGLYERTSRMATVPGKRAWSLMAVCGVPT
jgi:hypothetical protein